VSERSRGGGGRGLWRILWKVRITERGEDVTDDPVDYEVLAKMYEQCWMGVDEDPITDARWEDGVWNLYRKSGNWAGMTSQAGMEAMRKAAEKEKQ
jgi:hypothetical protein